MQTEFETATFEDIEEIIALCNECFEEETDLEYAKKVFRETEGDENQIYLVGKMDGKIVAHMKITVIPTIYQEMNTYAILNHICVKPEYRKHHIATEMLKEGERICRERGCVAMKLWSMNFRQPAHKCYLNYGFEVDDAKFFSKEIKQEKNDEN